MTANPPKTSPADRRDILSGALVETVITWAETNLDASPDQGDLGMLRQRINVALADLPAGDGEGPMAHLSEEQRADVLTHISGLSDGDDTYTAPEHGWTCFHCGGTFWTYRGAKLHFGTEVTGRPICCTPAERIKDTIREHVKMQFARGGILDFVPASLDAAAAALLSPSPVLDGLEERVAGIVDPFSFKSWQTMVDHCLSVGDDEATARRFADATHKSSCDEARTKARAILALIRSDNTSLPPTIIGEGDPLAEADAAVARIMAMSDEEIMAEPGAEQAAAQVGSILRTALAVHSVRTKLQAVYDDPAMDPGIRNFCGGLAEELACVTPLPPESTEGEGLQAAREIDRLSLVILSAVNYADKSHLEAVSAALKANRAALPAQHSVGGSESKPSAVSRGAETPRDPTKTPCRDLTDQELLAEQGRVEKRWDDLHAPDENGDEFEGHGGSPGEWMVERLDEIATEQSRRASPQGELP